MSTTPVPPPPAEPVPSAAAPAAAAVPAAAVPAVPYGPGPSSPGAEPTPLSAGVTAEGVAKGVGSTAVKWGIRILLTFLVRAIFRALTGR